MCLFVKFCVNNVISRTTEQHAHTLASIFFFFLILFEGIQSCPRLWPNRLRQSDSSTNPTYVIMLNLLRYCHFHYQFKVCILSVNKRTDYFNSFNNLCWCATASLGLHFLTSFSHTHSNSLFLSLFNLLNKRDIILCATYQSSINIYD